MSRVPIHTHENIHQGGHIRPSSALSGGLDAVGGSATGPTGATGATGAAGASGSTGPYGIGMQGDEGEPGPMGPPGPAGSGSGSALAVSDEGVTLDTAVSSFDFTGAGVTATNVGHAITVNVLSGGTGPPGPMGPWGTDGEDGEAGPPGPQPILPEFGINAVIGDGATAMATGSKGFIEVPFGCTVTAARLAADVSGSVVVDVKKATYAGLFVTASICAAAKPTLSSAQKSQDSTLTGWTTAIAAGDWLEINVDSVTTIKRVTLSLTVRRTT